jgi:hypothetical protein
LHPQAHLELKFIAKQHRILPSISRPTVQLSTC